MADELDKKMCADMTKHAQLGNTGSCMCGYKLYPKDRDLSQPYPCPFCSNPPNVASYVQDSNPPVPAAVYCVTEGCPAHLNEVSTEKWNTRRTHEQDVAHIPTDEPIFVLRAQDQLALIPGWTWVDLAERKDVPEYKVDSATARLNAMDVFQRTIGGKMPD